MAELLVLAFDTFNPDPQQDLLAYKLGHVIDIKPDGHVWGAQERLPKFFVVKIPTMKVEDAQQYMAKKEDITNPDDPVQIGMRKFRFNPDTLAAAKKTALLTTGTVSIATKDIVNNMALVSYSK